MKGAAIIPEYLALETDITRYEEMIAPEMGHLGRTFQETMILHSFEKELKERGCSNLTTYKYQSQERQAKIIGIRGEYE